jgi:hypothetical protein
MRRLLIGLLLVSAVVYAAVTIKNDTFTVGSDTLLSAHTSASGGAWQGTTCPNFTVLNTGGYLYVSTGTGVSSCIGDEAPSQTDYVCTATVTTGGTSADNDRAGIVMRADGTTTHTAAGSTYYFLRASGSATDQNWNVFRADTGTPTTSGFTGGTYSGTLAGVDTDDPIKLRMTITGSASPVTLLVEVDENIDGAGFDGFTTLATVTDTAGGTSPITTAGNVGVYMRNANATLDDLVCEDLTGGVVPIINSHKRRRTQ